ncbi:MULTISPECIES: MetQ/NlpA family ABC transporter substrate-binding protein [Bradyrhizobium]|uniref:D-methionine transport system substrate-binding protein n=1 Tax=Bradyrhizobium elkanii TaxID=29448 RepID=A0A8I2C4E2_BRAEL|nr:MULTISPECIES: MetQ/NlpA family ABC transporter substrate-binding protein [Bradyrhizobium]MBP1294579.1 D-methionine transport system substrate-binding protein [Bradyrhizobium elkanii]MCP1925038.1 D-methionine transport system substrate-binding protein [Bradyrhizobium elkanii]MCS3477473.1 D-methionine transport system substrate-binding protein [Bradyrhizobium elkanii]MCS3584208.1 D-methionine transport system substrate-binding protein [Bradyrhizobium elkanii]MCS3717788.1 D-methionine transpor
MTTARVLFLSTLLILGALTGAALHAETSAKSDLKVGFVPGPYIDEFKVGVAPELEKKGYSIRYVEFSTGLEANNAVFKGEIDANVMQHTIFLNSYNERQQTDLVGIVHVPTPPMGLYSKKHPVGSPIKPGSTVAVPNDPVNLQRALWILRDLGLVEIRDSKPVDVSELDVIKNPGGIKIVPLEAAQAPRALDDVDFAAIQGNFAIYSGLKLTNAFALEKMTTSYINVVAVKQANAGSPWAQDIVAGYKSQTFKTAILSDRFYDGFTLPDYLKR